MPVGLTYKTFPSPHSHTLSLSEKVASSGQASRPRNMISKVIASKLTRQRMESIISIRHITPSCCSASKHDPTGISPTFKDRKSRGCGFASGHFHLHHQQILHKNILHQLNLHRLTCAKCDKSSAPTVTHQIVCTNRSEVLSLVNIKFTPNSTFQSHSQHRTILISFSKIQFLNSELMRDGLKYLFTQIMFSGYRCVSEPV